jgi:hypothetical protein
MRKTPTSVKDAGVDDDDAAAIAINDLEIFMYSFTALTRSSSLYRSLRQDIAVEDSVTKRARVRGSVFSTQYFGRGYSMTL